jgi:ABC-type microcin C transport system permease subunit YejB
VKVEPPHSDVFLFVARTRTSLSNSTFELDGTVRLTRACATRYILRTVLSYLARRVAALGVVLIAVSVLVFAILRLIPGDPAALLAGVDAQPEEVERLRTVLGLDQPAYVQYVRYLRRVITGDLGRSLRSQQPVATDLATRFRASLFLASVSLTVALLIGLPAGVTAAVWRGSTWDTAITTASVLGASMPTFWFGLILIGFFSVRLGWLPTSGYEGSEYVVLPAVTLAAFSLATIARTARSCMLDGDGSLSVHSHHTLLDGLHPLLGESRSGWPGRTGWRRSSGRPRPRAETCRAPCG